MPLNKDQLLRYQILDRCFSDGSKLYKMSDLVEAVNAEMMDTYCKKVSKRSIQNDVQLLQYEPYNVEFDADLLKQHYYRYADTSFCLPLGKSLTDSEMSAVRKTVELLRPIADDIETSTPLQQWMFLCLQRLAAGGTIDLETPGITFENNDSLAGMGNFRLLAECVINHQPIKIGYRPFSSAETKTISVHPYLLKQYNGRWFLLAANEGYNNIGTYPLDRIRTVRLWKAKFRQPEIDMADYFSNTMGVTVKDEPAEHIVLKISAKRYPYVETKPFSDRQKIVTHDDESYTISFPMRINNELVAELLSFGDDLKVVEPEQLRNIMADKAKRMSEKYSTAQKDCTSLK
ncbi:MAG: WYL domain-containing protein [Salinivirgaceae bacterium]|nr:WYL domain-containing protein [Salinivirgaceae bacterium]